VSGMAAYGRAADGPPPTQSDIAHRNSVPPKSLIYLTPFRGANFLSYASTGNRGRPSPVVSITHTVLPQRRAACWGPQREGQRDVQLHRNGSLSRKLKENVGALRSRESDNPERPR
jgi:hypothetical protein